MKNVIKFVTPLVLLGVVTLLVVFNCGKDKATTPPGPTTEWTILSYGAGNNNLDYQQGGNSYCIQDVQDMEKVGSTDKVQIIAMVSSIRTGGIAKYYHVEHYPDDLGDNLSSTELANKGTKDMSDPQTLKDFIVYGLTNYPAKKYMLIIDDHGGGWRGACEDEQNGSGNLMSMVDLSTAVEQALAEKNVPKFNIVTFHACLMSMVEVAYEMRMSADYLVASEFSMPMESVLGANEWLTYLTANPTTGAADLANRIPTAVYNAGNHKQKYVHMAASDLSKMPRLAAKISDFGTQIRTSALPYFDEVLDAWLHTNTTDYDDPANVDLREFALKIKQEPTLQNINLIRDACDSLIAALNSTILITNTNAPGLTRGGFTIYLPYLRQQYDGANYARLHFNDVQWANFVEFFIETIEQLLGYTLTVNISPAGTGTVTANPNQQSYQQGDVVTLTAVPAQGYTFDHWTIQSQNFTANPIQITFGQVNIEVTAHFTQGGGGTATINGTVTWPGHTLSSHSLAFGDTIDTQGYIYRILQAQVNPANGAYSITVQLSAAHVFYFDAVDDVNNNSQIDAGDGWGFYDANQSGTWDTQDGINVVPGQTYNGVNITLQTLTAAMSSQPKLAE